MQARRESPYEDAIPLATSVINSSNQGTTSSRSYINCVSEQFLGGKREMGKNLSADPCFPLSRVLTFLHFLMASLTCEHHLGFCSSFNKTALGREERKEARCREKARHCRDAAA